MSFYADTSFLVSLYTPDKNSAEATSIMKSAPLPVLLTAFGEFELMNAFQLRLFRRELVSEVVRDSEALFQKDIESGVFIRRELPPGAFMRARNLALNFTGQLGTRSLDVLHVAFAIVLGADLFRSFDKSQLKLARAAGLNAL